MIVLVGFMGAGKSTVGRLIARDLGLDLVDVDAAIVAHMGQSIPEAFASKGEAYFRRVEREVATRALSGPEAVVALGGGSLGDPLVRGALHGATVVHLDVAFDEALRRVGADRATRPMLERHDPGSLFEARRSLYERLADVTVASSGPPDEIAARVLDALEGRVPRTERSDFVRVEVATARKYDVVVGEGLLDRLFALVAPPMGAEKVFVVTQEPVRHLTERVERAAAARGLTTVVLTIPDGERAKSLETVQALYRGLGEAAAHRWDPVVAVGGGVVTDVGGFVASTFNRGMPLVNVPTTLLAQVDAAVGGKTGINLPHGKNLVGTFYQPTAVVCDVETLGGLPDGELRSGMAEVVKYALIGDAPLARLLEERGDAIMAREPKVLVEVVTQSAADKASVVEADEREGGVRAHLNYGHTFAHAIERMEGFGEIRHGEAVAIGMMAAAHLARELGRVNDACVELHRRLLESFGLPTSASLRLDDLESAWLHDKKFEHGARFVLLRQDLVGPELAAEGFGAPEAGVRADPGDLRRAVDRLAG